MSSRATRRLEREKMRNELISKGLDTVREIGTAAFSFAKTPAGGLALGYASLRGLGILQANWKANNQSTFYKQVPIEETKITTVPVTRSGELVWVKLPVDPEKRKELIKQFEEEWAGTINNVFLTLAAGQAIGSAVR